MQVILDASRCQGHAQCHSVCPEIFELDDYGHAAISPEDGQVPAELKDQARRAAEGCPERAIALIED